MKLSEAINDLKKTCKLNVVRCVADDDVESSTDDKELALLADKKLMKSYFEIKKDGEGYKMKVYSEYNRYPDKHYKSQTLKRLVKDYYLAEVYGG